MLSRDIQFVQAVASRKYPHQGVRWEKRGQATVEWVLISTSVLLLIFGGLQLALILNAALAVSQYSYAGARYAAVHGDGATASTYGSTITSNVTASPTISGSSLTTTVSCVSGCTGGTIATGAQLQVTVSYNLSTGGKLLFGSPFLGFTLPTSVSNTTYVMAE